MITFPPFHKPTPGGNRGVALIIVLVFVVLLTGLIVAFFSRALTSRQISNSSASQTRADMLARSAADIVVGDLKQEMANGSTATTTGNSTIYTPSAAANMLPARSGNPGGSPDPIPNLVRRSVRSDAAPFRAWPRRSIAPQTPRRTDAPSASPAGTATTSSPAATWARPLIPRPTPVRASSPPIG